MNGSGFALAVVFVAVCPAYRTNSLAGFAAHPLHGELQEHLFGLIDYPAVHLGKSSVFAAYAVHGCVVLNTAPRGMAADGLQHGCHYLTLATGASAALAADAPAQAIANAARAWYAEHPLRLQAAELLALLGAGRA